MKSATFWIELTELTDRVIEVKIVRSSTGFFVKSIGTTLSPENPPMSFPTFHMTILRVFLWGAIVGRECVGRVFVDVPSILEKDAISQPPT